MEGALAEGSVWGWGWWQARGFTHVAWGPDLPSQHGVEGSRTTATALDTPRGRAPQPRPRLFAMSLQLLLAREDRQAAARRSRLAGQAPGLAGRSHPV